MSIYRKFYNFGKKKGDYTFVLTTLFLPIKKKPYFVSQEYYKVGTKEEKKIREDYFRRFNPDNKTKE